MSDFRQFVKMFIYYNKQELVSLQKNNNDIFEYLKTKKSFIDMYDFVYKFLIQEPLNYFKDNEDYVVLDKETLIILHTFIEDYSNEEYIYWILDNYEDDILKSYKYFKKYMVLNNENSVVEALWRWQYDAYDNFLNEILELFKKYLKKKINE